MIRFRVLIALATAVVATPPAGAQQAGESDGVKKPEMGPTSQPAASRKQSVAEQIVELERSLEGTDQEIQSLTEQLNDPDSEFAKAKASFVELDKEHDALKEQIDERRDSGDTAGADELEAGRKELESRWRVAKDRLDVAIDERKTLEEKRENLRRKRKQDQELLETLLSPTKPTSKPADATSPAPAGESSARPADRPAVTESPPEATPPDAAKPAPPPSKELREARQKAAAREQEAAEAEQKAQTTVERLETVAKDLETERRLLDLAERKADVAREQEESHRGQLSALLREGAAREKIQEMNTAVNDASERLREARREVKLRSGKVEELLVEYHELQTQRIADLGVAEEKRQRAAEALREVQRLQNPFSRANLLRWFNQHAARVLFILVSMIVLILLTRVARRYIIKVMVGGDKHGTEEERYDRAQTLVYVFQKVAYFVIVVSGLLMILTEVGINMVPLIGGAAALSVAVGFGAQSLIKDYFSGFMILLENQYGMNDVVKIGGVAGLVERVGLRVTVLRDLEGTLHFIPNGQATVVSNLTHGWSRVVLDVRVGYREDIQRVMDALAEIGSEIRAEREFGAKMIGEPEILGVDALGDWAIIIKVVVKTRPMQQWTVKREFLRRIKTRFDELGIEIPFPHRIVYQRRGDGTAGPPPDDSGEGQPPA